MKKRIICLLLAAVMLFSLAPNRILTASAAAITLPETELPAEILASDVFYLASARASVREEESGGYLLRVGRGGSAESESAVLVKISDVTASYGRDYTVSVLDGSAELSVPEENPSLMDRILGQPFTVTDLKDEEEAEAAIAEDPEAQTAAVEGLKSVLGYLQDAAGLGDDTAAADLSPLEQARNLYTGVEAGTQSVTTTQDMMQQIQSLANVMTTVVPGADVTLRFAPGETEKYLVITPEDNREGDGDRYFYVILSETSGTTTNSALSTCAVTIWDDEEQKPSVLSFSAPSFSEIKDGMVTVTILREGALNTVVTARIRSTGGTAQAGRDYSAIDREILLPFGVSEYPVEIPVCTEYFDGEAGFTLELEAKEGCTVEGTVTAEVTLQGEGSTRSGEAAPILRSEVGQTLTTVRTDTEISVINKWDAGNEDNDFSGTNAYDSTTDSWLMQWKGNKNGGTVGAIWQLTDEEDPFWYSGVRVNWEHEGSDASIIATVFGDHLHYFRTEYTNGTEFYPTIVDYLKAWGDRGKLIECDGTQVYSYRAKLAFGSTVVDLYPSNHVHETAMEEYWSGTLMTDLEAVAYVAFYNRGNSKESDKLYIKSLTPILRPFQVSLISPDDMSFLQADGSYRSDGGVANAVSIKDSVNGKLVAFLDDSVTVLQPAASNTARYAALTGLTYYPGGDSYKSFPLTATSNQGNDGSANLTVTLDKDMLRSMFSLGVSKPLFIKNQALLSIYQDTNPAFYTGSYNWNCPTYGVICLKPQFEYINAQVTLENPYEFPISVTVSGTDYWLEPNDSVQMEGIHLGDTLAVSDLKLYPDEEELYCGVGVNVEYFYDTAGGGYREELKRFNDNSMIYIGSGKDHRLDCREVVIRPSVTSADTKIVIRVKTDELGNFDPDGFLTAAGVENDEYTEFLYAAGGQVVNGKIYPLTATPVDADDVCVWTVYGGKRYVGNTFLYEGGNIEDPAQNIVTLSTAPGVSEMKIVGTLNYMTYNLSTLDGGDADLTRPASGAAVMAGSMYGIVADDGTLETTSMKVPANPQSYRVRCLVSANGTNVIKDIFLPSGGTQIDISTTFPSGLSPVLSDIFQDVKVTAANVGVDGLIPIGSNLESASVDVSFKPMAYVSHIADGSGGFWDRVFYETPLKAEFVILDQSGRLRYTCPVNNSPSINYRTGEYSFHCQIPFLLTNEREENGETIEEILYCAEAGDRIFVRLTTDLLRQAADLDLPQEVLDELNQSDEDKTLTQQHSTIYTYSEVYTGLTFYAPPTYTVPIKQGLSQPIKVTYTELPFLGNVGKNLNFPFVNVGWMPIEQGYRMYIGVSPVNIYELKQDSPIISKFVADDGNNWGALFSMKHPFESFSTGLKAVYNQAFKNIPAGAQDVSSLGKPQWKFNMYIGVYFDFWTPQALNDAGDDLINVSEDQITNNLIWAGIGGYVSFNVGFKTAWYTIIPVVFIPAYIGITIDATAMGFLGATRRKGDPEIITYDDATRVPELRFEDRFDTFNYCIQVVGNFEISAGVGLYGTVGVRVAGVLAAIGLYEPTVREDLRDWGAYLDFQLGFQVDLFLTSVGKMWSLKQLKFGKFEDFENHLTPVSAEAELQQSSADPFSFREGPKEASQWLGNSTATRGAFTPKQTYTLVENSYERADPQLLTMEDGTVVLAYLANDPDKGPYQRTTLMLTSYRNGVWSEPVAVSEDGTADFSPSIARTKDGKVLIAWVSTEADDITADTPTTEYLRSMEIYAAFADIGPAGEISVGETVRISRDRKVTRGISEPDHYYDSDPTVVCDPESGDAVIYYVKSASVSADAATLANPYLNDSVICYVPYDGAMGKWMTDEFYPGEVDDEELARFLLESFCGQRFLDGPTFQTTGGELYYAIPDFTAVGSDGQAICAYTVDRDSTNDTEADKELFLQVYSFREHKTTCRIRLTNDAVADALPQFFCASHPNGEQDSTKLFWYRNGDGVVCIDVNTLLAERSYENDEVVSVTPSIVGSYRKEAASAAQMADFRTAEDANGNLYVVWTESVSGADGASAQELFAISYYSEKASQPDAEETASGSAGWSKPYQLTHSGMSNDEIALIPVGEDLLLVHNQFLQTLGESDDAPLVISQMRLAATTLEPCGSVETESVKYYSADGKALTLPQPGETVTAAIQVSNNGLTTANGYHVDVYEMTGASERKLWSFDSDTRLIPNSTETLRFDWELPTSLDGACLRIETRENLYNDSFTFTTEPLETRADYAVSNASTYQAEDGFHLRATVTNNGNAPSAPEEMLTVRLTGPFSLPDGYEDEELNLYAAPIGELAAGESKDVDVIVPIPNDMIAAYTFIDASVSVRREKTFVCVDLIETRMTPVGSSARVEFKLSRPVNFTLNGGEAVTLRVNETKALSASMELAEKLGGGDVVFTVADPGVVRIENGGLLGVTEGSTTVYATHSATGAVVSVPVTVSGRIFLNPFADVTEERYYYDAVLWAYNHDPQITAGTGPETFSPNRNATRAQVVTFLWHAAGEPAPKSSENPFADVPDGQYYTEAVLWAAEQGITKGTSETTFSPNKTCTRGEIVTFLWRFAGSPEAGQTENPFADVTERSFYYKPVLWAAEQEITAGTSAAAFSPGKSCTRGEIVTFLWRLLG